MIKRLKLMVVAGMAAIMAVAAFGASNLVRQREEAAWRTAEHSLEGAAVAVENALDRQLLQVDGALASFATLFDVAQIGPGQREAASRLLRGLNFQTMAFRDLQLVGPDGSIVASARASGARHALPLDVAMVGRTPTNLIGPLRNAVTGDWALYVARRIPAWHGIIPVAEVPLHTLMKLLGEASIGPGTRISLERANGEIVATLPHDELLIGKVRAVALPERAENGKAFMAGDRASDTSTLNVVRNSLYGDIRVVLSAKSAVLLADWRHDRDRTVTAAAVAVLLLTAFAGAILLAIHQRERADAERARAATVLDNAIDAMSDGFVMWDRDDRLVTCNQRYRELYALSAPFMVPGARFEDIIRKGAELGQYPQAGGDIDAFVRDIATWHRQGSGSIERLLPGGRWLLISERRMRDGGTVGIRTDITALKEALADLAVANMRANEAAEEARQQNVALLEQEGRIRFLAHHDDLTGLQNRFAFRSQIAKSLLQEGGEPGTVALLFLDLDRFKDVNDTLGHPVGDLLLLSVAERLATCVPDTECVARLGGDEFAVLSLGREQPQQAQALGARIIEILSQPYSIQDRTISISASVGIAIAEGPGFDADLLLKQADLALYQAKAEGRGVCCVFTAAMDEKLRARLALEMDLRKAIEERQFELSYQPIFDLKSSRLCGFEALLRWHHPGRGLVGPAEFVPLAEETRLIVDLGEWVIRQACMDAARLPGDLRIAVNLSPVQLIFGDAVATVRGILAETGLDPARLELEITETALLANDNRNLGTLKSLKELGVRIVLDDFGTGYSSLSHLRLFPLDKIKIDRSFVRDMTAHSDSAAIVAAVAALAAELGMATTAEGIETQDQLDAVDRAGCTEVQGYLLGKPQPILQAIHTTLFRRSTRSRGGQRGGRAHDSSDTL
ncbi:MAG: EAL domain-containing protein [Bosea sp.]|uniref:bifunctional diguanylate cyclase/phosphodiesterase n=1 Tax=Bosea sp. (in: a-proteobacteria) TaxID=1871050 RepID=UPI001AC2515F|nr:EAL domain-containing protein [Bosea sp. (in: a-proteobacteria)]MBN9453530.1 EAL domain-containing protein [Bosea sp. (in: a-proteobacteria)]